MAYNFAQLEGFWTGAGGSRKLAPVMAAIGLAESRGRNIKQQGQPYSRTGWGIWQITPGDSEPQFGVDRALLDPHRNAEAAVAKERSQGLGAWTTYTSGAYKAFMPTRGQSRQRRRGGGAGAQGWGAIALSHFAGVDQGVDFNGSGAIPALGDGRVTDVGSASIIEGGSFPVVIYELDNPPVNSSGFVYVAENFRPTVKRGKRVKLGDPVGEAAGKYPYIELGWNSGPKGWSPVAPLNPDPHGAKQAGRDFWSFVQQTETGNVAPGPAANPTIGSRSRPGVGGGDSFASDAWSGLESAVESGAGDVGSLFSGIVDTIGAPLDFLKAALWLVNPLNWLRAVEVVIGAVLILLGILIAVKADELVKEAGAAGAAVATKIPVE